MIIVYLFFLLNFSNIIGLAAVNEGDESLGLIAENTA